MSFARQMALHLGLATAFALIACQDAGAEASSPLASAAVASARPEPRATGAGSAVQVTGVRYAMAQQVQWLGSKHFIVGRWDGSISLFEAPTQGEAKPTLVEAFVMPGGVGVQMLTSRDARSFVSSADPGALLVWRLEGLREFTSERVEYPDEHGTAVTGMFTSHAGQDYLLTGHENGELLIWSVAAHTTLSLQRVVDLRMEQPIDYLHDDYPLRHIRGLSMWKEGIVIAGGEDGGIHQVRIDTGEVLTQRLFNPKARLGVNDLTVHGNQLLVVNCALDREDHNLWLFDLGKGSIDDHDATNLLEDQDRGHIFAFDLVTYDAGDASFALVSTKEGLLWRVRFDGEGLKPLEHTGLGRFDYGNAIDLEPATGRIATAGIGVRVAALAQP